MTGAEEITVPQPWAVHVCWMYGFALRGDLGDARMSNAFGAEFAVPMRIAASYYCGLGKRLERRICLTA